MKKVTLLGMVLVLCLAVVGIGYAGWTKDLFIQGTVGTGELNAEWQCGPCTDTEIEGKEVSEMTCTIDGDTLVLNVINGYPCITYTCEAYIENTGSIPLHIDTVSLNNVPAVVTVTVTVAGVAAPFEGQVIQVHPGASATVIVTVHLDNEALENYRYSFGVTFNIVQYNETYAQAIA